MKRSRSAGAGFSLLLIFCLPLPAVGQTPGTPGSQDGFTLCFDAAVTGKAVNIRALPTEESPALGRVWSGVSLRVLDLQAGWFLVEAPNKETGWIRSEFLRSLGPCEGDIAQAPAVVPGFEPSRPTYRIQPGDVLDIRSYRLPEINARITVRPDGFISALLLDDVFVQGMTLGEVDTILTRLYQNQFRDPDITIGAEEIRAVEDRMVFIGGEVMNPLERTLHTPITVLQGIIAAGGFTVAARPKNVILIRKDPDGRPLFRSLDLSDIRAGEAVPDDVYLQPYDVVYVPATAISKAGDFVDQYVNRIIPQALSFGINWLGAPF
jgi:protein involved in polysaccharide export with SLBB domain